jgi:hypothetical protein
MITAATVTVATRNFAQLTRRTDGIHFGLYRAMEMPSARNPANVSRLKIRARKFDGRCARHKRYNPAVDGMGGVRGGCPRCLLLYEIWEASLRLNRLIRQFDPGYDDLERPPEPLIDPRQMSLIGD